MKAEKPKNPLAEPYEPKGTKFYDGNSKRQMMLVSGGHYKGWICYKHPDGQWVTLRKATRDDRKQLDHALSAALHGGKSLFPNPPSRFA